MAIEFDPSWEYWAPDEEVAELLSCGRRCWADYFESVRDGDGLRFGSGDPDRNTCVRSRSAAPVTAAAVVCSNPKCLEPFTPKQLGECYCSMACRKDHLGRFVGLRRRRCRRCGGYYLPSRKKQRVCSPECGRLMGADAVRIDRSGDGCLVCGGEIPPSKARNPKNVKVYCSVRCKKVAANRRLAAAKKEPPPMPAPSWLSEGHKLRSAAIRVYNARDKAAEATAGNGHVYSPAPALVEDYRAKLLALRQMIDDELESLGPPSEWPPLPRAPLEVELPKQASPAAPAALPDLDDYQDMADRYGEAVLVLVSDRGGKVYASCVLLSMAKDSEKLEAVARLDPRRGQAG